MKLIIRQNEIGSSLLYATIFSAITLILLSGFGLLVKQTSRIEAKRINYNKLQIASSNQLANFIANYNYESSNSKFLLPDGVEISTATTAPFTILDLLASSQISSYKSRSLILSNNNHTTHFAKPSWSSILKAQKIKNSCKSWQASNKKSFNSSSQNCTLVEIKAGDNMVFGNIITSKLDVSSITDKSLTIFAIGDTTIENFVINSPYLKNIGIISVGDIKITQIETQPNLEISLFLHSSTGSIEIQSLSTNYTDCISNIAQPIRLTLAARSTIKLEENVLGKNTTVGCTTNRNEQFWKSFSYLGNI
jgi:hypothetical protein